MIDEPTQPNFKRGTNITLSGDDDYPYQIDFKEIVGYANLGSVSNVSLFHGNGNMPMDENGIVKLGADNGYITFICPLISANNDNSPIRLFIDPCIATDMVIINDKFVKTAKRGTYYSCKLNPFNFTNYFGPGPDYNYNYLQNTTLPVTWSIVSGSLPPGLSLNASTGEISGTPT